MTTTKAYDDLVEKLARERDDKLRGNISSVKMSEVETAKEIADITGNAFNSEPSLYNPSPDGTIVLPRASMAPIPSIEQPKKKRGRPKGSKNRPKSQV